MTSGLAMMVAWVAIAITPTVQRARPYDGASRPSPVREPKTAEDLPPYRAQLGFVRDGFRNHSQIRAVVPAGAYTEAELLAFAEAMSAREQKAAGLGFDRVHVMFLADRSTFVGWDGTGLLRDSDWPHWLYDVRVEGGVARRERIATDLNTKVERIDVFRAPGTPKPETPLPKKPETPKRKPAATARPAKIGLGLAVTFRGGNPPPKEYVTLSEDGAGRVVVVRNTTGLVVEVGPAGAPMQVQVRCYDGPARGKLVWARAQDLVQTGADGKVTTAFAPDGKAVKP